ncbi:carbohydrate ABC transporter permease [Agilicoccus flavus]|uniref:carbohydrate ABC transporter permease n=1 Tax=Agilicoccus flavus TaxID=2775968 RepID=UPI001CF62815|nr:sugar ABC transporter permease [Agilicoccus flavus]
MAPSSPPRRRRPGPPGEPRAIAWVYVAPALLVYGAFLLYPLVRSVQISFYDWDGLTLGTWVGFDNYVEVLRDEGLRAAFGHALVLMLFFAVIPLVVGLMLAAILDRAKVHGLGFFRTVVFLPQVVAMVVVAVAWRRIYAPDGTLNSFLQAVGLDGLTRAWLGDYALALPAVGFVGTWFETGLVTVLMLAGMGQIDRGLYEAARLDGAGPVREFFSITLPAVRGEISVALTLTVIAALKTFDLVYVTTKGGPGNQTSVPSYEVYHRAFELGQVGLASAIGVSLTIVIFAISFLITRIVERGEP